MEKFTRFFSFGKIPMPAAPWNQDAANCRLTASFQVSLNAIGS